MRRTTRVLIINLLALALFTTGCSETAEPVRDAREALGTIVTITAYGEDESAVRDAIDTAFEVMDGIETELDVHEPGSALARHNQDEGASPAAIKEIASAIQSLEVERWFSLALFDVTQAWSFENGGRVPRRAEINAALEAGGIDAGGATKGLALDAALGVLQASAVDAALLTAGSTTLTFGDKPDGSPWRIGVEDPRDPSSIVTVIEATGNVTVSTSGDYQRYFESDGIRYHHIIDPASGEPARGLRSLTVVGTSSGLDSDILSTALFVAGPADAEEYAADHSLGLFMVDDQGRALIVPGPGDSDWRIARETEPVRN